MELRSCTVLATCLLGAGDPAPSIVLDGHPIATVNVWTMRDPALRPEQDDDAPEPAPRAQGAPILKGMLLGGASGCVYGIAVAGTGTDISHGGSCVLHGLFLGAVGAGIGAWIKALR